MIEQGKKVKVCFTETKYNTNRKSKKEIKGIFIKDYGKYIQILDKFNLRRSIMKQDLISVKSIY